MCKMKLLSIVLTLALIPSTAALADKKTPDAEPFDSIALTATVSAPNHRRSDNLGQSADRAGDEFKKGALAIAQPFIVVARTTIDGVAYVGLKGAQGTVYVAESLYPGLEYMVIGTRILVIDTINGLRALAIDAIKAGKVVIKEVVKTTKLVIDGITYELVQIEKAFTYLTRNAIELAMKAGKLVINGVTYFYEKTADGIIWVAEQTKSLFLNGWRWADSRFTAYRIHRKMATSFATGEFIEPNITYFSTMAEHPHLDASTRQLAAAARDAAKSYIAQMKNRK